jgi:DNA-binding GntR family transcriptional regulator
LRGTSVTPEQYEAEIARLTEKCRRLAREVHQKDEAMRAKNIALDALNFVWCDGACPGGVNRYSGRPVSEAMVLAAERQARRLRRWWTGAHWKIENWPNLPTTQSEWHRAYLAAIKAKLADA